MIISKFIRMDAVPQYARFSFTGFVLGFVYIAFINKKVKKYLEKLKPGVRNILLTGITNIIPFLTVGFLIVLVESSLKGFNITVFSICGFMIFGSLLQAIEFMINKMFLYELKIEEMAHEEFDKKRKIKELEQELLNE